MCIFSLLGQSKGCNVENFSLGNPSKDSQRFVDAFVLITAPDWPNRLSNFENVVESQFESVFERRTLVGLAKLNFFSVKVCQPFHA